MNEEIVRYLENNARQGVLYFSVADLNQLFPQPQAYSPKFFGRLLHDLKRGRLSGKLAKIPGVGRYLYDSSGKLTQEPAKAASEPPAPQARRGRPPKNPPAARPSY